MDTKLESEEFETHWTNFLNMVETLAFSEMRLHKIFTYAFDLRPHLYVVLEKCGFFKEAILREHILFEKKFINVVIHSKINNA